MHAEEADEVILWVRLNIHRQGRSGAVKIDALCAECLAHIQKRVKDRDRDRGGEGGIRKGEREGG